MRLSVILATRDRRDKLPVAIASVMAQRDPRWELVVLDNGASIADLVPADPRIVYRHAQASGPADAFNQALALATGDVVMPLGDDDWLDPTAVGAILANIGDARWGYAQTAFYRDERLAFYCGGAWDFMRLRTGFYLGGAVFWRRSLTDRIGGFDPAYDHAADWDLYLRFGDDSDPVYLAEHVLYHYVEWPGTDTAVNAALQHAANDRIVAADHALRDAR